MSQQCINNSHRQLISVVLSQHKKTLHYTEFFNTQPQNSINGMIDAYIAICIINHAKEEPGYEGNKSQQKSKGAA